MNWKKHPGSTLAEPALSSYGLLDLNSFRGLKAMGVTGKLVDTCQSLDEHLSIMEMRGVTPIPETGANHRDSR